MAFSTRSGSGRVQTQTALADINITPLVDVVLVLLLIFMLTAPVLQSGIDVADATDAHDVRPAYRRAHGRYDRSKNSAYTCRRYGADKLINIAELAQPAFDNKSTDPSKKVTVYLRADEQSSIRCVRFGDGRTVKQAGHHQHQHRHPAFRQVAMPSEID